MSDIVIGKHTLESLTTGMYSDPYVVFREYIQNSTDSIDAAYKAKLLKRGNDRIEIQLQPSERRIVISDNGLGLPSHTAEKTLVSIGNSRKSSENSRGFRGIGRLAALSYCKTLTFVTSFFGEDYGTKVTFDAQMLSELLSADTGNDTSVIDVLKEVYTVLSFSAQATDHYFKVILEGVEENSGLNDPQNVFLYLSQNVPVPYSPEFTWGREIVRRLKAAGFIERKYNIYLTYGSQTTPVYKPYRDEFLVDKGKNITDTIRDVSIIPFHTEDRNLVAIGWLAKTNYLGSIYEKSVKGIRIRKGNILVGDSQTLNTVFKDARFNGWTIGEIFAVDKQLIPNARRDNFEKNPEYFYLIEQLTQLASTITRDIRNASMQRNSELAKAVSETEVVVQAADNAISTGIKSSQKVALRQKLTVARDQLQAVGSDSEVDEYSKGIAFEELDMLIGRIKGATTYKAINLSTSLSKTEKKILETVFNTIIEVEPNRSDELISAILKSFS